MMLTALKADSYRIYGRFNWFDLLRGMIVNRNFRVLVTLRLCQAVNRLGVFGKPILLPMKLLHAGSTAVAKVDFPWNTNVGAGLAINHGFGMVVNGGVSIGSNVTLFHGVTLGRRDRISENGVRTIDYPVIEDEVWIGPHAIIVGGVTIGCGSRIGGGAFVGVDIPPYSIVAGNPSHVVRSNCVPDVMNKALL